MPGVFIIASARLKATIDKLIHMMAFVVIIVV